VPGDDIGPVSYGRWQAEHGRLADRVTGIEHRLDELETEGEKRAQRRWMIALAILTSFLLPLLVAVIVLAVTASLGR
jgi:hypothetical protein